jgi:hypothetical protein
MDKTKIDELLTAAKVSNDETVKQALDKLLFVVSIAHDKDYIERANTYAFHSGCTITVPRSEENFTMTLLWNEETISVRTRDYQYGELRHGHMLQQGDPVPGMVLNEERNYQQ